MPKEKEKLYTLADGRQVTAGDICYNLSYWISEYLGALRPRKADALEFLLDTAYIYLQQYGLDYPFDSPMPDFDEVEE